MPSSTSPRGVDASDGSGILGFTSALRSQLAGSQSKFDSWVEGQKARADEAAAAHAELVEARRLEIRSLEAELRMIRENLGVEAGDDSKSEVENGGIARQRQVLRERQVEIEGTIADLHLRQRQQQKELEDMKKEEAVQKERADEACRTKQKAEALKDQNLEDLTVGMVLYKRLGLTFEKGEGGSLRFVFTLLDPSEPRRPFGFTLCVNDDALYEIRECSPSLPIRTVADLSDELNKSHDGAALADGFSTFVQGVREAFKATI